MDALRAAARQTNQEKEGEIVLSYEGLPRTLREGTRLYIEQGILPGSFLRAVISNDLRESFAQADHVNQDRMFQIVQWFYNECPIPAWGSKDKMMQWKKAGGMKGIHKDETDTVEENL